jgi:hypothetical protein
MPANKQIASLECLEQAEEPMAMDSPVLQLLRIVIAELQSRLEA